MKKIHYALAFILAFIANGLYAQQSVDQRVDELLNKMTLEQKVGQMTQVTLDVVTKGPNRFSSSEPFELDPDSLRDVLVNHHVGSILNTANNKALKPEKWHELISQIQDVAMKNGLEIPVIYGVDEIHGATYTDGSTFFPQQINFGAARNEALVKRAAEITAYETRASSVPWTFSPVLDLGINPRFPRMWETFGADPYLASKLGVAMINGYEGSDQSIGNAEHIATSLKHFIGYHATTSGKDRTPSTISKSALREYHLPPFKAAIEAGASTIMINSGLINGIPVHINASLLTDMVKGELGFNGFLVTDWGDIENIHKRDKIARTDKEAIKMAINAGVDMSMVPYNYEVFYDNLIELVHEGKVDMSRIDDAVRRILRVKFELDLFDHPTTDPKNYPKFGSEAFGKVAYDAAAESITLLKNKNDILPLSTTQKVLVTGPNANSMRTLNGAWSYSWQGEKTAQFTEKYNTILEAVQHHLGKNQVSYIPGVSYKMDGKYYEQAPDRMKEAVKAAKKADVVLLCLGENSYTEKPGDLNDLYLNEHQVDLAKKITATGTPVVLILNEGRPRIISQFEKGVDAVVQAYLPGNHGGDALADILFGEVNPSGKLPYNYPRYPNALINYIHKSSEEQEKAVGVYNYEADYNPQYEFGDGLSYTSFAYSDLTVNSQNIQAGETLDVSVKVKNSGSRKGKETVELYTSDLYASQLTPDVRRLRAFKKIELDPGEMKTVNFSLTTDELRYVNPEGNWVLEPGKFKVKIGELENEFELNSAQ